MAKILFIIAQEGFRDEELFEPKEILKKAKHSCYVSSITTGECTGKLGRKIKPDLAVKDARAEDYDVIVIVGGPGAPSLMEYEEVMELLRTAEAQNKIIAAICIGPIVLAHAGILEGKKATVFPDERALTEFKNKGVNYIESDVVVDGKIITSPGPKQAKKFGEKLVEILQ